MPDHLDGRRSHDSSRNRTHILLNRVIETFRHLNLPGTLVRFHTLRLSPLLIALLTKTSAIMRAVY